MGRQTTKPKGFDPARRAALLKLGRFAVYTAPVMSTLLISSEAQAGHNPVQCSDPPVTFPPNQAAADAEYRARHCTPVGSTGASPTAEGFSDQKSKDQPTSDGF